MSKVHIRPQSPKTAAELVAAVKDAREGDTIELAEGTFEVDATLELKGKMTLKGAGMDKTTLTHTEKWKPSTKALPDPEMKLGRGEGSYMDIGQSVV
jgi:hypothetical protein